MLLSPPYQWGNKHRNINLNLPKMIQLASTEPVFWTFSASMKTHKESDQEIVTGVLLILKEKCAVTCT